MKKIINSIIILLCLLNTLSAQTVITLNQPENGVLTHKAQEKINLETNYNYKALNPSEIMHAHINPAISVGTSYSGETSVTDIDNRSLNTGLSIGTTVGSYSVSGSGGATYTIPISLPKGTAGMEPSVALSYNSQSGEGIAGYGWNISGLSSITRASKNIYDDGYTEGMSLSVSNNYTLDGNRFKLNGTTPVTTQQNASHKITPNGNIGGSPEWFKVEATNGLIMEFGKTIDARFMSDDGSKVIIWNISKVYYQYGNYMEYKYNNSDRHPRIEQILYTGNTSTGLSPYNEINFYYNTKSSDEEYDVYIDGSSLKSKYLLRKINVKSFNNTYREYELTYNKEFYSMLKSVQEKGLGGDELNATIFKYGDATAEYEMALTDVLPADVVSGGDFNGDGKSDVLMFTDNVWGVFTSDGDGSNFTPYVVGPALIGTWHLEYFFGDFSQNLPLPGSSFDFNGDGKSDILLSQINATGYPADYYLSQIRVELVNDYNNTTPLIVYNNPFPATWINNDLKYIYSGDFDGDGKDEIMVFYSPIQSSTPFYFAYLIEYENGIIITTQISFTDTDGANLSLAPFAENIHVIDFDGDGKSEIMAIHSSEKIGINACEIYEISKETGSPVSKRIFANVNGYPHKYNTIYPGDFNGDGKTDIVTYDKIFGAWVVGYSTGKSFVTEYIMNTFYTDEELNKVRVGDYNGDGKADLFYNTFINGITYFQVLYSKGNGFNQELHSITVTSGGSNIVGDFDGDGKTDVLNQIAIGSPCVSYSFHKNGKELLLDKLSDGMSNTVDFDYKPLTNSAVYIKNSTTSYPFRTINAPINVVSSVSMNDGIGGTTKSEYSYKNAIINLHGKGFLGYTNMDVVQRKGNGSLIGKINTLNVLQTNVPSLLPYKKWTYAESTLVSTEEYDTEIIKNTGTGTIWTKTNEVLVTDNLRGTSTNINSTWNNTLRVIENSTVVKGGGLETINTDYDYAVVENYGEWNRIKLENQTVTTSRTGGGNPYTRSVDYQYNPQGTLVKEIKDDGTVEAITTDYQNINSFGLAQQVVVSAAGVAPQTNILTYDNNGRFVIKETNVLGQFVETIYNEVLGVPKKIIGIDGLATTFTYDGFGRLTKKVTPDGIENNIQLNWDFSESLSLYNRTEQSSGSPTLKTIFDQLGRAVKTERDGFNQKIYTNTTYDGFGNVKTTTAPYFTSDQPIVTTYNYHNTFKNRLTQTVHPAITVNYTHAFSGGNETITTSSPNGATSKTIDFTGKTISSTDDGGTLVFNYYSSGLPKQTTLDGVEVASMEYDLLGNQTLLKDPNAGETVYEYNPFGQLIYQQDAKNNIYEISYDLLGRVETKSEKGLNTPPQTTTYSYYPSGNGINQIKEITYNGITQHYTYDYLGRLTQNQETVDGNDYTFAYEYDNMSRVKTTTYPSGFKTNHTYNTNGYAATIADENGVAFWSAGNMNAYDQYLSYTLGNGLTTTKTYDDYGMPTSIQSAVQHLIYEFDPENGNLKNRQDFKHGGIFEEFEYDPTLHKSRLTETKINGVMQQNIQYQTNGNIANKTDAGNYTYDVNRKNAVTQVSNVNAIISNLVQDITYTPFNSVLSIKENNKELQFTYAADQQRRKMQYFNNNILEKTTYYFGNYEKIINETTSDKTEMHYIAGGDGLVAIHVITTPNTQPSSPTTFYTYTDHLDSILTLTNNVGDKVFETNFDAWGRTRNTDDWTYDNTEPYVETGYDFSWLTRGYTGSGKKVGEKC